MPDTSDEMSLVKELEGLVATTVALTRIMESQQEQIACLVDILEKILNDPEVLHENQAPLRNLIAAIKAKDAGLR